KRKVAGDFREKRTFLGAFGEKRLHPSSRSRRAGDLEQLPRSELKLDRCAAHGLTNIVDASKRHPVSSVEEAPGLTGLFQASRYLLEKWRGRKRERRLAAQSVGCQGGQPVDHFAVFEYFKRMCVHGYLVHCSTAPKRP